MDTVKYCIVKNVSVNPVIFDWVHYMKRLVKYFLFCALNNHKIEILCFFSIPRKSLWYNIEEYHYYTGISL